MIETKKYIKYFAFFIAIFVIGLAIIFPKLSEHGKVGGAYIHAENQFPLAENHKLKLPESINPELPVLDLTARSVLVKDLNSDLLLFEKNTRSVLPIASLTKLLTAIIVEENLERNDEILILPEDLNVVSYRAELVVGKKYKVADLLGAMLIGSANDATMALARSAGNGDVNDFVKMMNDKAADLLMNSSSFQNPVGFDHPEHYSTAEDLTRLIEFFLKDDSLAEFASMKEFSFKPVGLNHTHRIDSTNLLLDFDGRVSGIKTGYTEAARGNLIILVEDIDHPFYLIVLGSLDREGEAKQLMRWTEENFVWN